MVKILVDFCGEAVPDHIEYIKEFVLIISESCYLTDQQLHSFSYCETCKDTIGKTRCYIRTASELQRGFIISELTVKDSSLRVFSYRIDKIRTVMPTVGLTLWPNIQPHESVSQLPSMPKPYQKANPERFRANQPTKSMPNTLRSINPLDPWEQVSDEPEIGSNNKVLQVSKIQPINNALDAWDNVPDQPEIYRKNQSEGMKCSEKIKIEPRPYPERAFSPYSNQILSPTELINNFREAGSYNNNSEEVIKEASEESKESFEIQQNSEDFSCKLDQIKKKYCWEDEGSIIFQCFDVENFFKVNKFKDLFGVVYNIVASRNTGETIEDFGRLSRVKDVILKMFDSGFAKLRTSNRVHKDLFVGNCWDVELYFPDFDN